MDTQSKTYKLSIPSSTKYLNKVEAMSVQVAKDFNLTESDSDDLAIVVTELVNNAIHHGNNEDLDKTVTIVFCVSTDSIEIKIKDQGTGFNPNNLNDPLAPENLLKESGRGIFLIRQLMDSVSFNFTNDGTEVITLKKITTS
jgi:serine/threonine-protein kinase RsbW